MLRAILHADMNSFYASVEAMQNPALKGKAVAVCGSTEDRHGIVLAKSELAKKYGVKTGMVNWEARQRCPELIVVPPHYDLYLKYSKLFREICYRHTDLVEPFGMDECWLDITDSMYPYSSPLEVADVLRTATREELGLTISVGVSFNKVWAKLGSDLKKPDAVTCITPENYKETVWPLAASEMIYVGRSTEAKLSKYGIHTIGELAKAKPDFLRSILGVNGLALWRYANGTDASRVMHKEFESPVLSLGHGITCTADLETEEAVYHVILQLCQDLGHRLRVHAMRAQGVRLSVRGNDLQTSQYQAKFSMATRSPKEIADKARNLFDARYCWSTPVRAVTVSAIYLCPELTPQQLDIFSDAEKAEKQDKLDSAVDELRQRFGKGIIRPASTLGDIKIPDDGRDLVRMPGLMFQ